MVGNLIGDHFCEDAHGRDGHGHASESKETLCLMKKYVPFIEFFFNF
jgi:hypothetical protein